MPQITTVVLNISRNILTYIFNRVIIHFWEMKSNMIQAKWTSHSYTRIFPLYIILLVIFSQIKKTVACAFELAWSKNVNLIELRLVVNVYFILLRNAIWNAAHPGDRWKACRTVQCHRPLLGKAVWAGWSWWVGKPAVWHASWYTYRP